jgi:hypothetical protein
MTPLIDARAHTAFHANDTVRLLDRHGDFPSGAAGRVVGCFARAVPTYVVSFGRDHRCLEVRSDEIVLTDEHLSSA